MTGRRRLVIAVALCTVGSVLLLLALAMPWVRVTSSQPVTTPQGEGVVSHRRDIDGGDGLTPIGALVLAALAGTGALIATRGRLRTVTGVGLALVGASCAWYAARVILDPADAIARRAENGKTDVPPTGDATSRPGAVVGVLGGLSIVAAGAVSVAFRRGPSLSLRYDSPGELARSGDVDPWAALDHGHDPTS